MREGWEIKKLGDLTELITKGTTPTSVGFKFEDEGINFVKIESITSNGNFIVNKFAHISNKANESLKRSQLKEGDILFSIAGALGRTAIVSKDILPANTNQALSIIRLKVDENVLKEYILLALTSGYALEQIEKFKGGVAQQNLSLEQMKSFQIPVPPLQEQKQIVAILDQAFEAIDQAKANIEKNIANAKELFQSKLNAIFSQKGDGWEEKKLIEVNKFIDYRGKTPKKTTSGVKLITAKNVRMGYMRNDPEEFIAEEDYNDWMTRGIPKEGDVLFTTEAPLANVTLLNTSEKIALAQRIITLCPNREILSGEYLTLCLQSKVIQDKILEKGTGATVTGIKSTLLKEITIPIPSIKIQNNIVLVMNQMRAFSNEITNVSQKKSDSLDNLKKSILQKAFTGELTNKEETSSLKQVAEPTTPYSKN